MSARKRKESPEDRRPENPIPQMWDDQSDDEKYTMTYVIPSADRATSCITQRILPTALWCVPEEEADDYRNNVSENLLIHPPLVGLARKRTWILENVKTDIVVMMDDDVRSFWKRSEHSDLREFGEPDRIDACLRGLADLAWDIEGVCEFGVGDATAGKSGAKATICMHPFAVRNRISGGLIGVVQKNRHGVGFDPLSDPHEDYDFCLSVVFRTKIVLRDNRYALAKNAEWTTPGGISNWRTAAVDQDGYLNLVQKFGKKVVSRGDKNRININIPRPTGFKVEKGEKQE